MEKDIKTIAEQVEENKGIAQILADFIFEKFTYIESVGNCFGSEGESNAVANITRKRGVKAIGDYPLPLETEN